TKDVRLVSHRDAVEKVLKKISKEGRERYLIVCTGHQGEPKAVLSRIARRELGYTLEGGDIVVFSCNVIPVDINKENREKLEKTLRRDGVRIFRDVHVSGHAAREDHRDLLEMIRPQHIIPIHAEPEKGKMIAELALQLGMKNTHVMEDGKRLKI
ncbi:MAG: MBL fold metallo-hydrolase RNA specificity domain-containing protein, partial [Nanoarchaeota archaeon]